MEVQEEEISVYRRRIKQMRHVELLERVQQMPEHQGSGQELRVARMSRDQLISMILRSDTGWG